MNLPAQLSSLDDAVALPERALHLAIGMFDGVHLGHRAVVEAAVHSARASGGIAGVLTFWPHPSALFRPESPTKLMQDAATKSRMLLALGVDAVITQAFTRDLAAVSAEEFLPWLKHRLPQLVAVYVGENFRFGRGRHGDAGLLVASGRQHGVRVFSAPRVNLDGESISSTRIRALLEAGEMEAANALLGYTYFTEGVVMPGKRLGRTIGFPTLNVPWAPEFRPRLGVYAVRVAGLKSPTALPAVANYGVRPTVEKTDEPRLEAHLLGPCPFGEGDPVRIEWLRFLRPEMKFAGIDELRGQIARDRAAAESFFLVGD
jgi:riboflavin kinase / FMN adenylyltransferase